MGATTVEVDREACTRPRRKFRFGLAEGAAWVAAAAVAAFAVRSPWLRTESGLPDLWQAAGLVLAPTAVALAMAMVLRVLRKAGRPDASGVAWRLVAVAGLALFVAVQADSLRRAPFEIGGGGWAPPVRSRLLEARLVPSCGLVGMLGLVLAWAPAPRRKNARPRVGRGRAVAAVALAGLAGVILLAATEGAIVMLILVAVEAVARAAPLAFDATRPGLVARTVAALPPVGVSAAACVATAAWLARDLRSAAPRATGRAAIAARLASLALAAGSTFWLVSVTLPAFSPELSETFARVMGPAEWTAILASFAAFSAGLAARGTAPRTPPGPSPALGPRHAFRRLGRMALVAAVACAAVFTILLALWPAYPVWPIDAIRAFLDEWSPLRILSLRSTGAGTPAAILGFLFEPSGWPVISLLGWLFGSLIASIVPRDRTRPAALDAVCRDPATVRRFLTVWASLLVLMLAAMVTLGWAGYLLAAFVHF